MSRIPVVLSAAAIALTASAVALPAAHADTLVTSSPDRAIATRAVVPNAQTSYLVATHSGGTARLQLVERATGATTGPVLTAPMSGADTGAVNPFTDAQIAPDGTIWAIRHGAGYYDSTLLKISGGHAYTFMPYVVAARVSPDGTHIAMTVVSPDADHDGKGTTSLRIATTTGKNITTVRQHTFPVNAQGLPNIEVRPPRVQTWLGNGQVAVTASCCDSGYVSLVGVMPKAENPTGISGSYETAVIAKLGTDTAIVPKATRVQAKDGSWGVSGYDIYALSPARPSGRLIGHVATSGYDHGQLKAYVAEIGATPMSTRYGSLPYKTVAGTTLDGQFIGR